MRHVRPTLWLRCALIVLVVGGGALGAGSVGAQGRGGSPRPGDVAADPGALCFAPGGVHPFTITNRGPGPDAVQLINAFLLAADGAYHIAVLSPTDPTISARLDASTATTILSALPDVFPAGTTIEAALRAPAEAGTYTLRFTFPTLSLPVTVSDACPTTPAPSGTIAPRPVPILDVTGSANEVLTALLSVELPEGFAVPMLARDEMHVTVAQWPDGRLETAAVSVGLSPFVSIYSTTQAFCGSGTPVPVTIRHGISACRWDDSFTHYSWSEEGVIWAWTSLPFAADEVDDVSFLLYGLPATR